MCEAMSASPDLRSSIDPEEVERFSRIAAEWWDPHGKFAPLHRFNPTRLTFIRDKTLARFGRDPLARRPFEGLRLLDIGCGGGLLSEPMSRLGFAVTGVDASERNIGTASTHAAEQGLTIDYRCATAEQLLAEGTPPFDVILNMEVIEHVADPGEYLRTCSRLLAPGGLMIVATLNRTLKAFALAKVGAEYVLRWLPAGTHDWTKFLKPDELRGFLKDEKLQVQGPFGVAYDPMNGRWCRSSDCDINYMMTVTRDAS
ncbi:MAG: bifunctional 2-polyprenyl-6-hydroxyphenol methylase/3-demethylubiquinol 3-O-methyltransferase UbiG [Phenylobacterium sp.]|uniref:bifunctional 2-polyprenyl-6-hydroxyphenol methylase/3-demethylubiquinol 3-O-methyltransferase UbiG n=1 Tax=Phenylobacterium sp. TaxID=1871053 RepID=UPI00273458BC|nr:bifunctional 2-polyprenyl-6-hydroxyphenol methylase/3-demethylubiquinol 3-O-methyltransferase UbiG [Phenylobacterium sp.]MDP3102462.1 bifunctional 2-polyprenyl-6-hydroxyphenol methylase/3-demethylubiquinol 3-O-methyltransferase UbiG [Phenylobacterium sp.]